MAGGAERAVLLTAPQFHLVSAGGPFPTRDVLAPVAAHLCNGVDLSDLGVEVEPDLLLPGVVPLPREEGDAVLAEVLWIDRVGNCQLNIGIDDLDQSAAPLGARLQVVAGDVTRMAERVEHPGQLGAGSVGLMVDPYGMVALVLDRRSAAEELDLGTGSPVTLSPLAEGDRGPGTTSPVSLRPHR
jgi:S-adenosylmethionine hydrolase